MVMTHTFFRGAMWIVLAWMACLSAAYAAQAGNIARLKGDVYIARPDVPVVTAKGDDAINEGDLITTAKGAEVLIRFKDNSIITLRPDSSMLVKSFRHEDKASDSFLTNLLKGGLRTVTGLLGKSRPESPYRGNRSAHVGLEYLVDKVIVQGIEVGVRHETRRASAIHQHVNSAPASVNGHSCRGQRCRVRHRHRQGKVYRAVLNSQFLSQPLGSLGVAVVAHNHLSAQRGETPYNAAAQPTRRTSDDNDSSMQGLTCHLHHRSGRCFCTKAAHAQISLRLMTGKTFQCTQPRAILAHHR